jgi:hypothetical protein
VATGRRGASRALRGGTTQGATLRRARRTDRLEDVSGRKRATQRASKPEAGDARMATGDETCQVGSGGVRAYLRRTSPRLIR